MPGHVEGSRRCGVQRDPNSTYTILGVEFVDGIPQCWFPGNCRKIVVQLGTQCLREPDRACFQLAHETVHLLSPTGGRNANVLEEGLASHFQMWYMAHHYPSDWPHSGNNWNNLACASYEKARALVEKVLNENPNAIRILRESEPVISKITDTAIVNLCPGIAPDVASQIVGRFER